MKESYLKKKQKLRNNEYYNTQNIYDKLYSESKKNRKFKNLIEIIKNKNNILLAYRNIKQNKGSKTPGTDGLTIEFVEKMGIENYIKHIQNKIENYNPKSVRRVEIPKSNGKKRPLGIPCIDDRIIQQCIKQVLEPICEAKFHKHSYGFRPNRSTSHAIARCQYLINKAGLYYVVDVDIKGFFDNVNHSKLKKQMWNMGIQDKCLISVISKILNSEIEGIGRPNKGTPQGGIISPLLSNIVLNELDWWIGSQWENFETDYKYAGTHKYKVMKNKTNLKEMWIVRYADDFKIFCRDWRTAQKIYTATKKWLKERLSLDISPDKSKITNLRKNHTEFLGFKFKANKKGNKYVCHSRMSDKSVKTTVAKLKEQIKIIQKHTVVNEVNKLNLMILGSHNYYKYATHISEDFSKINFLVNRTIHNRLKQVLTNKPKYTKTYMKLYGKYKGQILTIKDVTIFPIYGCKNYKAFNFQQEICNYTRTGRKKLHDNLKGYKYIIYYLLSRECDDETIEFNDNRISLIAGQQGKCYVTGKMLEINKMECHHKIPKQIGGTDEYKNLVWINSDVHKLVHCKVTETINEYLRKLNLSIDGLNKVNSLRKLVGNSII